MSNEVYGCCNECGRSITQGHYRHCSLYVIRDAEVVLTMPEGLMNNAHYKSVAQEVEKLKHDIRRQQEISSELATDNEQLRNTVDGQLNTIKALMMGVEEHTGKEGTTAVLVYIARAEQERDALSAYVERLRIVLVDTHAENVVSRLTIEDVLDSGPIPSLAAHDQKVRADERERCADIAADESNPTGDKIESAIRNLPIEDK